LTELRAALRARHGLQAAALAGLLVALALPGSRAAQVLRYERAALAAGQWWRLVSAHLVHFDVRHLALNLAGFALLWWLYAPDARPRDWLVVLIVSALTVSAGLWFLDPGVGWYLGASGMLHGAWAAAALAAWPRWRLEAGLTAAVLVGKLALERWHGPLAGGLDAALPVVTAAHRYGALGGLGAAAALRLWRRPV
jgi:rhomboid family GlyGly-CTERM serine protease